ncbi:MAG TPA: M1 family metallopeptidase [Gemmatimonadaceae bacterium]
MPLFLALALALQHGSIAPSPTTPPSGDTTGYWQQRIAYRIVARLDERAQHVHGTAELRYVNQSPDTLREMYVHQYLNAFRPGSRWSAVDEREGRVRFQHLAEPNYAYERFTEAPTVDGAPLRVEYPYAPDSTVARFALPRPLPPGDSLVVHFAWDARPSATVYRRQGRRGREYDFAQWYPKVAVYDRLGWEANPLVPAGELYGEFGTYDVTLLLPTDQVVGATGVVVDGDPGWERARKWGTVNLAANAYGAVPADTTAVPPGYRRVRFLAERVHHFAWTVSPDFRYEGALYRDSIPVHVLYRPGDEAQWGNGKAVGYIESALAWLERIYGPYGYPQVSGTHRLEGGATEFPMLVMYGGMSPGLVLHETGHIYSYGLLANNEWRSGWMDEGLTSFQSEWAQHLGLPARARGEAPTLGDAPHGYRALAHVPPLLDQGTIEQFRLDQIGRTQPIGTPAYDFSEFVIYNQMVYGRASMMYAALRDVLGDSTMVAFLHDYYARWKYRHVDEHAMRASAERVSGRDLGWFFQQWVHGTGLIDYALRDVRVSRDGAGWVTRARITREGAYRHPMPVGVRVDTGWVVARGAPLADDQWVEVRTRERPRDVRLDPRHLTWDWDRRNDGRAWWPELGGSSARVVFDWPLLEQYDRNRELLAVAPTAWYTDPGGLTPALRLRTNYQGWIDRWEMGVALPPRAPAGRHAPAVQGWVTVHDPRLPFLPGPSVGRSAGAWLLDGVAKLEARRTWDASPFLYANGPRREWSIAVMATLPYDRAWVDAARWADARVIDASASFDWRSRAPRGLAAGVRAIGGVVDPREAGESTRDFERVEVEGSLTRRLAAWRQVEGSLRLFGGASNDAPAQRSIGLSALDPTETFENHLLRGRGAPVGERVPHVLASGGAAVRGYSPLLRVKRAGSANADLSGALITPGRRSPLPQLRIGAFADAAWAVLDAPGEAPRLFASTGLAVALRGRLYDRPVSLRVDVPLWVRRAGLPSAARLSWVVELGR